MPDRVLRWVGAGTPDLGETAAAGEMRGGMRGARRQLASEAREDDAEKELSGKRNREKLARDKRADSNSDSTQQPTDFAGDQGVAHNIPESTRDWGAKNKDR